MRELQPLPVRVDEKHSTPSALLDADVAVLSLTLDPADIEDPTFFMEVVIEVADDVPGAADDDLKWITDCGYEYTGEPGLSSKRLGGNPRTKTSRENIQKGRRVRLRIVKASRPLMLHAARLE